MAKNKNKITIPILDAFGIAMTIVFSLIIFSIVYYIFEDNEYFETSMKTRYLQKDGFSVLYDKEYSKTTGIPCHKLKKDVLSLLPTGYSFIDYIYKIQNVALSTFHRDVTSSKNTYNTKYPVYTLILYKYDGDLLSICPASHTSYPFVWSKIVNIQGKSGTAFLFDCDILHAGCTNNCSYRELIQYKICHDDDKNLLSHLSGVNIDKTENCVITYQNIIIRKLSYYFELIINCVLTPLLLKREKDNTIVGYIQSYIPITFYNNTN